MSDVLVLDMTPPVLVFHDPAPSEMTVDGDRHTTVRKTRCGQVTSVMDWWQTWLERGNERNYHQHVIRDEDRRPVWMRRDHADRIGRPCRRCFPEDDDR